MLYIPYLCSLYANLKNFLRCACRCLSMSMPRIVLASSGARPSPPRSQWTMVSHVISRLFRRKLNPYHPMPPECYVFSTYTIVSQQIKALPGNPTPWSWRSSWPSQLTLRLEWMGTTDPRIRLNSHQCSVYFWSLVFLEHVVLANYTESGNQQLLPMYFNTLWATRRTTWSLQT